MLSHRLFLFGISYIILAWLHFSVIVCLTEALLALWFQKVSMSLPMEGLLYLLRNFVFCSACSVGWISGADQGGGWRGCAPPPPPPTKMSCCYLIRTSFLQHLLTSPVSCVISQWCTTLLGNILYLPLCVGVSWKFYS